MSGAKKAVQDAGKSVEQGVGQTLGDLGRSLEQGVSGIGKNIERNAQNRMNDLAMLAKGNFNNIGQSMLAAVTTSANPMMLAVNPDDMQKIIGETGSQRYAREQAQKAVNEQANVDAAKVAEELKLNASTVAGLVDARKRAPGRAQTFISGSSSNQNTLLTLIGNR